MSGFDAMVLAAGFGRRLRPLTDRIPKALVDVGGQTQLERTLEALETAGADRIVVNTHHHAGQVEAALAGARAAEIRISREDPRPLETGGGLVAAREHFRLDRPILVHNVDVICGIDLAGLVGAHEAAERLATLAVHERAASRYLLFDDEGLQGRLDVRSGRREESRSSRGPVRRLAFTGIHVVSPGVFDRLTETGAFSIVDAYLRLAGEGAAIGGLDATGVDWWEIGTPERLAAARAALGGTG